MSTDAPLMRPARADVAASYDRGVDAYVNTWSAVIQPPAKAVVAALDLSVTATVVDIGAGSGAMVQAIRRAALKGRVVAIDASVEMLRAARERTGVNAVHADTLTLPVRDACTDGALLAFVLFHLADPHAALIETARVLRSGGRVGTVTWSTESTMRAFTVWDSTLTEAGAPGLTARRVDAGLDNCDAVTQTLARAGLNPERVWLEPLRRQWTLDTYWQMATGSGLNRLRLDQLDYAARADTLTRARRRLQNLEAADFAWRGEVVCAVATR
jgi:ubiquinone/menaquinone biosynthesis C-methylase UbiE